MTFQFEVQGISGCAEMNINWEFIQIKAEEFKPF